MLEDSGNKCGKCQNHDYEVLKKGQFLPVVAVTTTKTTTKTKIDSELMKSPISKMQLSIHLTPYSSSPPTSSQSPREHKPHITGHARDCPFKKCECLKCRLLDARSDILQVISGKETKLKGTKKDPNCGFCQNHGIKILRKGKCVAPIFASLASQ